MKRIDLHTHSTASDGIKSPKELIDYAMSNGVVVMAITDHDTIDGLPEAVEYANKIGFNLIPGIEFSIDIEKGSFHLIGLNIDYNSVELVARVKRLSDMRDTRAYRIIDDLKRNNIDISIEEVEEEAKGGAIGRPHVARVMIKHGYASNIKEVFNNYLVKGKPGYVKKEKIALDEAILLINGAGGIPIIAHPISLELDNFEEYDEMMHMLVLKGVKGIEVYSSMHTPEQVDAFHKLADTYDLIISGGSDYHGDKNELIGFYNDENEIPFEIYDRISARIRK